MIRTGSIYVTLWQWWMWIKGCSTQTLYVCRTFNYPMSQSAICRCAQEAEQPYDTAREDGGCRDWFASGSPEVPHPWHKQARLVSKLQRWDAEGQVRCADEQSRDDPSDTLWGGSSRQHFRNPGGNRSRNSQPRNTTLEKAHC